MSAPVCVIPGAGPGNGAALARRFTRSGYRVAMLARDSDRLGRITESIDGAHPFACDMSQPAAVAETFDAIRRDLGPVSVLLYNAGDGQWGTIDETPSEAMEGAWRVNVLGLHAAAQASLPDMRAAGGGAIVVTGATASLRGGAGFTAFASAKAAQRSLAQSLGRHLGPENIHVALIIIDGVVATPRTREMMPDRPDEGFLSPDVIAESVHFLAHQPPSAWTFELDLRPYTENW
ncbi:SDR family NAD(P)-dependent oxidoreductase [Thiohalorhabdus sp.]|uniref:SDR family NAD(P)-dependent oxidoreductase n=1 Tax=Thiohalorhabdus sp. TaxID=3094134 RepID=UPI002FC28F56